MIKIFQLEAEIYISTFLADIIALYLLFQLITYCSISMTNLDTQHVRHVTIMNKNFTHVQHISFFLDAFNENSNQIFNLIINKIILYYYYFYEFYN